jgi:hypothetical protein
MCNSFGKNTINLLLYNSSFWQGGGRGQGEKRREKILREIKEFFP